MRLQLLLPALTAAPATAAQTPPAPPRWHLSAQTTYQRSNGFRAGSDVNRQGVATFPGPVV